LNTHYKILNYSFIHIIKDIFVMQRNHSKLLY